MKLKASSAALLLELLEPRYSYSREDQLIFVLAILAATAMNLASNDR